MPSKKPLLGIRTDAETIQKLKEIAEKDNRSASNLGEKIIKDWIKKYEQNTLGGGISD